MRIAFLFTPWGADAHTSPLQGRGGLLGHRNSQTGKRCDFHVALSVQLGIACRARSTACAYITLGLILALGYVIVWAG